jgi:hypothetical protein
MKTEKILMMPLYQMTSNDDIEATPETITKEIDQFNENAGSVAEDGQVEVEVANLTLDDEELQSLPVINLEERVKQEDSLRSSVASQYEAERVSKGQQQQDLRQR